MDVLVRPDTLAGTVFAAVMAGIIGTALWYLVTKRGRRRWGAGAVIVIAILVIWAGQSFSSPSRPDLYSVSVSVTSDSRRPLNNVVVSSSVGGEVKQRSGGWEIVIPSATLPTDRQVVIRAESDAFNPGSVQVVLENDPQPAVTIQLEPRLATLRGIVRDEQARAVPGARVHLIGYSAESVLTDQQGAFVLPTHGAEGQEVRVRAELNGFESADQYHVVNSMPMTIKLVKEGQ